MVARTGRPPGRPRDATRDVALLDATLGLLASRGYAALRLDDVAAAAGASKATIYRRWASREELVLHALLRLAEREVRQPDTGTLRGDLVSLMTDLGRALTGGGGSRVLVGVLQAVQDDPRVRGVLTDGLVGQRRRLAEEVLQRAVQRGELAGTADVHALAALPPSLVFFRVLLSGEPVDAPAVETLVDHVVLPALHGAAARPV